MAMLVGLQSKLGLQSVRAKSKDDTHVGEPSLTLAQSM